MVLLTRDNSSKQNLETIRRCSKKLAVCQFFSILYNFLSSLLLNVFKKRQIDIDHSVLSEVPQFRTTNTN